MTPDDRRSHRRTLRHPARLLIGPDQMLDCVLSDVSETGASIEVEDSRPVPDRFFLLLSMNGAARRICRVVWRKPQQVGVKFERSFAAADAHPAPPPPQAPEPTAAEPAAEPAPEPAAPE